MTRARGRAPVRVHPRQDGDPEPDVLGLLLAHRAMLRDLRRLTDLAEDLGTERSGRAPLGRRRALAVADYLDDLCASIHHHHSAEDEVLWPVIEASAGVHVDLAELSDDHAVLDPKLFRLRAAAAGLRAGEAGSDRLRCLAVDLADLRDVLTEHVGDEERTVVPVIRRYVSVRDWIAVEAAIRSRGAKLSFEAPRVLAVATPEEVRRLRAEGGALVGLLLALAPRLFRRRERLVFGAV